jgi:hypothetical protein
LDLRHILATAARRVTSSTAVVAGLDEMREAGMVFVLPLMIYPFAVGISGVIHLLWFRRPAP